MINPAYPRTGVGVLLVVYSAYFLMTPKVQIVRAGSRPMSASEFQRHDRRTDRARRRGHYGLVPVARLAQGRTAAIFQPVMLASLRMTAISLTVNGTVTARTDQALFDGPAGAHGRRLARTQAVRPSRRCGVPQVIWYLLLLSGLALIAPCRCFGDARLPPDRDEDKVGMWGQRRSPRACQAREPQAPSPSLTEGTYASRRLLDLTARSLDMRWRRRDAPQIVDVRRREATVESPHLLPGAIWREPPDRRNGRRNSTATRPIVVACKAGHEMSQSAAAQLRATSIDARVLEGGYEGWSEAGLPFVAKPELDRIAPRRPSIWVTRRRPKIDRIACPWLIRRFLDPQARISCSSILTR